MKYSKKILRSERGESLVSVLLAMIITGVCLYATLSTFTGLQSGLSKPQVPAAICREIASNVLSKIRSNGAQAKTFEVPPILGLSRRYSKEKYKANGEKVGSYEVGAVGDMRWPGTLIERWGSDDGRYKNHLPRMIQSSVNSLLSIYNMPGNNACKNHRGIKLTGGERFEDLSPDPEIGAYEVIAYLKLEPYDLVSGRPRGCKYPLWLRPQAITEPPPAVNKRIFDFSEYDSDKGIQAKVHVVLKPKGHNSEGRNIAANSPKGTECEQTDRFQFDRRDEKPATPLVTMSNRQMNIFLDPDVFAPGTLIMCRTHSSTVSRPSRREQEVAKEELYSIDDEGYYIDKKTKKRALNDQGLPLTQDDFMMPWRSCDRIELCGNRPSEMWEDKKKKGLLKANINIPSNCTANVEVRAVDPFGNVSDIGAASYFRGGTSTPRSYDDNDKGRSGYTVNGVDYRSPEAARAASDLTGQPIMRSSNIRFPRDSALLSAYNSSQRAIAITATTGGLAGEAEGALAAAQGAAGHARGATNSSTAASGTAVAQNAHANARAAANDVKNLADRAENAARIAKARSDQYPNDQALKQAAKEAETMTKIAREDQAKAEKAAREAYAAYLEAKRREEELRRKEEEERRRRERERRERESGGGLFD